MTIVWTPQAEKGLNSVLEYLEEEWTAREITNLQNNLENLLDRISTYPEIYPATSSIKNLHKGLVDKNNYLIYRVKLDREHIEIINFRGTRQEPKEL